MDLATGLTDKQQRFCEEYLIDLNATKAAVRAGYSPDSAYQIGCENLQKPYMQEYIQQLQAERAKRTQVTADQVLSELSKIAFSDITDFINVEKKVEIHVDDVDEEGEPLKEVYNGVVIEQTKDLPAERKAALAEISESKFGVKIRVHDKVRALELLGKHLGMFQDAETLRKIEELEKIVIVDDIK